MKRGKPLRRSGPLKRKKPINRVSANRGAINKKRSEFSRSELNKRPLCEAGPLITSHYPGQVRCQGYASELHESLTRARAPGERTILDPANTWAICRMCHIWIGDNVQKSTEIGLLIRAGGKPMQYSLDTLHAQITGWQKQNPAFSSAKAHGLVNHILEEAKELKELFWNAETQVPLTVEAKEHATEEMADLFHLLFQLGEVLQDDISVSLKAKFGKNQRRQWLPPDDRGVINHKKS